MTHQPSSLRPSERGQTDRLATLSSYGVLDSPPELDFDDLVHLARDLCRTEVAQINFLTDERQWTKAQLGTDLTEIPRQVSLCSHTLDAGEMLVIPDLSLDPRTTDNPFVAGAPGARFYAGVKLTAPDGTALGTLCVIDLAPRPAGLSPEQEASLRRLARQAMSLLELRRAVAARDGAMHEVLEADTLNRQILDSAVDYGIITMDAIGAVTSWNVGAERILGWSEAEMIGRPLDTIFTPEDVENRVPSAEMRQASEQGRGMDQRWHVRKDGSRFFASGELMPLSSAEGHRVGYLKILRDQTRARAIDDRLRKADERLRIALAASGVIGLWDWDLGTGLLHGDANFARLYGLDAERTADGLTMEEYQRHVVPSDLPDLRARIHDTIGRGAEFRVEYRLAAPGASLRWVECRGELVRAPDGTALRFSGSAVDITDRKQAELEARRLVAIVEQSADFIAVTNLDRSMAWVNEAGRSLVGIADAAMVEQTHLQDYFDPAHWSEVEAKVLPALASADRWCGDLHFRHFGSGELIPVFYDVIALRDDRGAVSAHATVTRDMRAQKQAEARQQLINEELSHRMKNTLAMVQAIASQTLRDVTETEAVAAFGKRIHAIASAHDVLLQKNWRSAKMTDVVAGVLGMFGLGDRFAISGPPIEVGARATLSLSLLLHELGTNALKHGALSAETGRISVTWKAEGSPAARDFVLDWIESGGPAVAVPARQGAGFGSRLIGMGLLGTGGTDIRYLAEGLSATFRAPLDQIRQE